jgi:RiboL-PSP-HEPN
VSTVTITRYKDKLDTLFKRGETMATDPELQAQWSRYLCVLVSGYIEVAMRSLCAEYARRRGNSHIHRFVQSHLQQFQNPKSGKVLDLLGSFSIEWRQELEAKIEGELKDSVDSIVNNKNNIAHGENTGISYVTVREYYRNVQKFIDVVESLCIG